MAEVCAALCINDLKERRGGKRRKEVERERKKESKSKSESAREREREGGREGE